MTVSNTNTKDKFTTNGVTVDFPFTFYLTNTQQVFAKLVDAQGDETDYTNFTVVKNPDNNGGTLTTNDVLDNTDLLIFRDTQQTQETDYIPGGRFPAESHEQALDKLTLINQEQQEELDRSLKSKISDEAPPVFNPEGEGILQLENGEVGVSVLTVDEAISISENAQFFEEIAESPQDTATSPGGVTQTTITGLATLATEQRDEFEQLASDQRDEFDQLATEQRDNFEATFQAQFQYNRIGNISDYVGDTLTDAEKLNSYQYPDDSDNWYGPIQDQPFPITIPADPTAPGSGWALVNGLTSDSLSVYTDIVYKASGVNSAVENMIAGNPVTAKIGDLVSTGFTSWVIAGTAASTGGYILLNSGLGAFPLGDLSVGDFGAKGDGVSNDHPAFFDAYNLITGASYNFSIFVPPTDKSYLCLESIILTRAIKLYTSPGGEDNGARINFSGASLTETNGTGISSGIWIPHISTIGVGSDQIQLPNGQVGDDGRGSVVSGLRVEQSSGIGVLVNTPARVEMCHIRDNTSHGLALAASYSDLKGNANHSFLAQNKCNANGGHGIFIRGNDANTFTIIGGDCSGNALWGIYDGSLLGGVVMGVEADSNGVGAYGSIGVADGGAITPSRTVWTGCYVEGTNPIPWAVNGRNLIIGSTGVQPGAGQPYLGSVIDSGLCSYRTIGVADNDSDFNTENSEFGKLAKGLLRLGFGSGEDKFDIKKVGDYIQLALGSHSPIQIRANSDFNNNISEGRAYIPSGFALHPNNSQIALPTTPSSGNYDRGAVIWNTNVVAGAPMGWVCTTSGVAGSTAVFKIFSTVSV